MCVSGFFKKLPCRDRKPRSRQGQSPLKVTQLGLTSQRSLVAESPPAQPKPNLHTEHQKLSKGQQGADDSLPPPPPKIVSPNSATQR